MINQLVLACHGLLQNQGFDYAFCGGHALDIHLGRVTRPHGDIDLSAWREDRDRIILFMQAQGWSVYEAMGGGVVHLITGLEDQLHVKRNLFCVKEGCPFFHVKHTENQIYRCDIDHVEQKNLDFIEFLFNERSEDAFIYAYNNDVRLALDQAILSQDGIPYFAPALALLYKSTDLKRKENRRDFDAVLPYLSHESKAWLKSALTMAFPDGHEWLMRLEK